MATTYYRYNAVTALQAALGWTDEQVEETMRISLCVYLGLIRRSHGSTSARKHTPITRRGSGSLSDRRYGDDRIAALKAVIAELEITRTTGTNELDVANAIIQLAAKRKTLMRLEASRTNEVSVVVQP